MSGVRQGILLTAGLAALAAIGLGDPADAATAACPTSNSPNTITLVGGTPQTAKLRQPFDAMLAVSLGNTNGCPVTTAEAGLPVTFTAPASGASGTFSASGSNTVTVGTNASGQANAPGFMANGIAGGYTVTASSDYGSITFSLTNTASGIAATITPGAPTVQSATVDRPLPAAAAGDGPRRRRQPCRRGERHLHARRRRRTRCRCGHCGCELRRRRRPGDRGHRPLGHGHVASVHRQQHCRHIHRDRRDGGCRRACRLLARQPRREAAHDRRSNTARSRRRRSAPATASR